MHLYPAVSPTTISSVLIRQEAKVQKLIYYTGQILHDAEIRYMKLETMAYALVISFKKLRSYFQAYTITILTDQPIRLILHRSETSGQIAKWVVELGKFDIKYLPRSSIKARVLTDFIQECTILDEDVVEFGA